MILLANANQMICRIQAKIPHDLKSIIAADDVLQEVWTAAFKNSELLRSTDDASIICWLNTTADRALINFIRSARCAKRQGSRMVADNTSAYFSLFESCVFAGRSPSGEVSMIEATNALRIALGSLSDDRKRAILLHHIEGLPVAEVAIRMNKSSAAILGLLYHGRAQLRTQLGSEDQYLSDVR